MWEHYNPEAVALVARGILGMGQSARQPASSGSRTDGHYVYNQPEEEKEDGGVEAIGYTWGHLRQPAPGLLHLSARER